MMPLLVVFSVTIVASHANGHGLPLDVSVVEEKLAAIGGTPDANGFAPQIYMDGDLDSQLAHAVSPIYGAVAVTDLPGFKITNMEPETGLMIEPLARPVLGSDPAVERFLWYCNSAGEVMLAGNGETLTIVSDFAEITLSQGDFPVPPLQVAVPVAEDIGEHVHYLNFLVDNSGPAAIGAYGFFVRFTSPSYLTSDPLLVVLNNGLEESDLLAAGFAINAAAVDAEPIPGDYDGNRMVDIEDYNFWRARFGNLVTPFVSPDGNGSGVVDAADFVLWRAALSAGSVGAGDTTSIPEPGTTVLLCVAFVTYGIVRSRVAVVRY